MNVLEDAGIEIGKEIQDRQCEVARQQAPSGPGALVTLLQNQDMPIDAAASLLVSSLGNAASTRALAIELGQATVAEIELSAAVRSVLDSVTRLVDAEQAALCLRDASTQRVQHFSNDDRSVVTRELPLAAVELLARQQAGAQAPLQRKSVCSGCHMRARAGDRRCMSLPLQIAGQSLGELCAMRPAGGAPFSDADMKSCHEYARWAAIALTNANKVRAAREKARVERETMVAHLHDNVAQTLSLLNMRVEGVEEALNGQALPEALARLRTVKATVLEVFGQVRTAMSDFRTSAPVEKDLITALTDCVEAFQETAGLPVDFVVTGKCMLPDTARVQAIQITREALVNIRRHAQATHVVLEVAGNERGLRILIQDNGVGFVVNADGDGSHLGLTIMRERARRSGAQLTIDSLPGYGTRVVLAFQNQTLNAAATGL